jgi:hypothetical protein
MIGTRFGWTRTWRAISRGWIAARPCRRPKRRGLLERLEDRIALSGLSVPNTLGPFEITPNNDTFTLNPGLFSDVTPSGLTGLVANFGQPTLIGAFSPYYPNPDQFEYTAGETGQCEISYYVTQPGTGMTSNTGNVIINVVNGVTLPSTPFFNSLRARRSIDPARFDFYHPRIGALLGMEAVGMPTTPATIVSANKDFDVNAARLDHAKNPRQYDQEHPVLGALFQLETPASSNVSLLPQTASFNEQRVLYDNDSTEYQEHHVYLGAIFAIENFEEGRSPVVPAARAQSKSNTAKIGSVHPAAAQMGHGKR